MKFTTRIPILLPVCLPVAVAMLACSAPQPASATPTSGLVGATSPPSSVTAPTVTTSSATPLPIPVDWVAFSSDSPRLTVYHPPVWTAAAVDDHHIEIRPATGFAWVEIDQIDATHPGPMGSAYNPHADVAASEQTLLSALREDGSYGDPVILSTRGGLPVWTVTGHNDPFDDDVVIGLQVLGDHALLVIGHQGDTPDDWESLKQMYLLMLQSLGDTGAP